MKEEISDLEKWFYMNRRKVLDDEVKAVVHNHNPCVLKHKWCDVEILILHDIRNVNLLLHKCYAFTHSGHPFLYLVAKFSQYKGKTLKTTYDRVRI